MLHHPGHHGFPRARIDPITDATTALSLFRRVQAVPRRHETLLVLLDAEHRGRSIVTVDGTDEPDQLFDVVECFVRPGSSESGLGAVLIASDRTPAGGSDPRDVDRWFELCDIIESVGVELVEWFVFGESVSCPRDLAGVPPRWRSPGARSA